MFRLEARIAIVTGAAGGIRAASARRMAAEGAKVIVADINLEGAKRVISEIVAAGCKAHPLQFDLID